MVVTEAIPEHAISATAAGALASATRLAPETTPWKKDWLSARPAFCLDMGNTEVSESRDGQKTQRSYFPVPTRANGSTVYVRVKMGVQKSTAGDRTPAKASRRTGVPIDRVP